MEAVGADQGEECRQEAAAAHVVHEPGWNVKFDGEELRVLRPDGTELT